MIKSGAPKGGRVHWLLWHLPSWFKNYYMLSYSYDKHNYVFYRLNNRRLIDVFIVYQSSLHYWRMAYVNLEKQHYESFGYHSTRLIAEKMVELYYINL